MINLRDNYWAVEVPDNAFGFEFDNPLQEGDLVYYLDYPSMYNFRWLSVPPGTWEIVCTSSPTNLELLHQVVERVGSGFKDYDKDRLHHDLPFMSPIDSLQSLLTSKGCDLNKNYLILKKQ
jgi:hypothetical protein